MNAISIISKPSKFYGERLAEGGFKLTKNLSIYLNSRCNFSCSYCIAEERRKNLQDVTLGQIETLISKIRDTEIDISVLGGEPFLHKDVYEILDRLLTLNCSDFVLMSNGTVPIRRFHPILYSLTYHDEQMTDKTEISFLKNCLNLREGLQNFIIELTFMTEKSKRFYEKLQELGLGDYVRQLTIDGHALETFARNVHCDNYFLNDKRISCKDVLKFRLNRFKGWQCAVTNFNLISGRISDNCGLIDCEMQDFDFEKDYVMQCRRQECFPECLLEGLKFKEI